LNSNAENSLEIELAAALLEEVFETLSQKIHDHHVIGLVIFGLLISNEVKIGHTGYLLLRR
jgi:hypothetical protein